jgi:membrane protein implicated in regulation of membrane protease activity
MNKFDEDFLFQIGLAGLAPVAAGLMAVVLLIWFTPHMRLTHGLVIAAAIIALVLFFTGRWAVRRLLRNRNDRLGYQGNSFEERSGPICVVANVLRHNKLMLIRIGSHGAEVDL